MKEKLNLLNFKSVELDKLIASEGKIYLFQKDSKKNTPSSLKVCLILQTKVDSCKISVLNVRQIESPEHGVAPEKARITFRNTWKTMWIQIVELEEYIADQNEDRIQII